MFTINGMQAAEQPTNKKLFVSARKRQAKSGGETEREVGTSTSSSTPPGAWEAPWRGAAECLEHEAGNFGCTTAVRVPWHGDRTREAPPRPLPSIDLGPDPARKQDACAQLHGPGRCERRKTDRRTDGFSHQLQVEQLFIARGPRKIRAAYPTRSPSTAAV
jgi:hypothetical protein